MIHEGLFLCDTFTTHKGSHASDVKLKLLCGEKCSGCRVGGKVSCNADTHEAVMSLASCAAHCNLSLRNNVLSFCTDGEIKHDECYID